MAGVLGWGQGRQVEASPRWWGTPSWVCGWGCALQPGLSPLGVYTLAHLLSVGVWGYTAFLQGAGKEGNSTALINPCETAEMGSHLKGQWTQAPRTGLHLMEAVHGTRESVRGTGSLGQQPAHTWSVVRPALWRKGCLGLLCPKA